mgnify:FL=1
MIFPFFLLPFYTWSTRSLMMEMINNKEWHRWEGNFLFVLSWLLTTDRGRIAPTEGRQLREAKTEGLETNLRKMRIRGSARLDFHQRLSQLGAEEAVAVLGFMLMASSSLWGWASAAVAAAALFSWVSSAGIMYEWNGMEWRRCWKVPIKEEEEAAMGVRWLLFGLGLSLSFLNRFDVGLISVWDGSSRTELVWAKPVSVKRFRSQFGSSLETSKPIKT